ncbi:hypothetical protein AB1Y20_022602 [Prymnesium parvum]|uniref:Uncharacterized protein n=1 Tax=Prymnesium parvum TaxID=97485 RepID=A0AB34JK04_PRYPA
MPVLPILCLLGVHLEASAAAGCSNRLAMQRLTARQSAISMAYRPRRPSQPRRSESVRRVTHLDASASSPPLASLQASLQTPYQKVHEIGLARIYGRRRWYREQARTGISPAVRLGLRLAPPPPRATPPAAQTKGAADLAASSRALLAQLEEERAASDKLSAKLKQRSMKPTPPARPRYEPSESMKLQLQYEEEIERRLLAKLNAHTATLRN